MLSTLDAQHATGTTLESQVVGTVRDAGALIAGLMDAMRDRTISDRERRRLMPESRRLLEDLQRLVSSLERA
jgi:hypothetical protein